MKGLGAAAAQPVKWAIGTQGGRPRLTRAIWIALPIWVIIWLSARLAVPPGPTEFGYWVVDYRFGFVRRGMAGEIADALGPHGYAILPWVCIAVFLAAIAAMARAIFTYRGVDPAVRNGLAIVFILLPCSTLYGLMNARPELLGAALSITSTLILRRTQTYSRALVTSAGIGIVTLFLTLVHEAIALEFSLGFVLSFTVWAVRHDQSYRRLLGLLSAACLPGILVALYFSATAGATRVAERFCAIGPAGRWRTPMLPGGSGDLRVWTCRLSTQSLDLNASQAVQIVWTDRGWIALGGSLGIVALAVVVFALRSTDATRVPWDSIRPRHWVLASAAAALYLPVFATTVDTTRWFVLIAFDVAVGYVSAFLITGAEAGHTVPSAPRFVRIAILVLLVFPPLPASVVPLHPADLGGAPVSSRRPG
ncbi:membrane protein [Tsukamurella soli]|uniref:Membrane protein n=2 Tax=Tsukamurella soli TaxID=644556 RepID=A0ABP8K556_9ACTN